MSKSCFYTENSPESALAKLKELIVDHQIQYIDLRFTDTLGAVQHITVPISQFDDEFINNGKMFDGSSIQGWRAINESDMLLKPDISYVILDPFYQKPTLIVRCDIYDPKTNEGYARDPRSITKAAEAFLRESGVADEFSVGPEPEFFLFDDVRWKATINESFCSVDSSEGVWNSETEYEGGNRGQRPKIKGGYFPVPPIDSSQDLRTDICEVLEQVGMVIEAHHHEVATGNQNEIATRFSSCLKKADETQLFKYVVKNVAKKHGKSATFMPKPLAGDNGNGMHLHLSLMKEGKNIFSGDEYGNLSKTALYFIGGVIKHAKALNAFTNPTTNSYKRLIPGFEAPTMLAYSNMNRSVAIRLPYSKEKSHQHIEIRFPDPSCNPYLAFSAILMAGMDGVLSEIDPGQPTDKDLYSLTADEEKSIPKVCRNLAEAIDSLDQDREFLLKGGVFSNEFIDSFIELKNQEILRVCSAPTPIEFELYYSS